jgi:hypothetical protein
MVFPRFAQAPMESSLSHDRRQANRGGATLRQLAYIRGSDTIDFAAHWLDKPELFCQ